MSTRKVLLVWPDFPVTYWGFQYALEIFGRKAMHPPLGLITVAALCPSEWEYRLVDLNVEPLTDAQIRWADMVFVSGMGIQQRSMFEILDRARALGKMTVLGGPFASGNAERLAGKADVMVLDEAEITIHPFLEDLQKGELKPVYRTDRKPDIKESPVPRFDLLKLSAYSTIDVQFSRGCPFNCEFCDIIALYGRFPRTKSPEAVLREFDALFDLGYRGAVFLVDDNFIGNKVAVKELLAQLIAWMQEHSYPFFLTTEATVNLAEDDELLSALPLAGFKRVFVGVETPSKESLKGSQKLLNARIDMVEAVHKIIDKGLEVTAGFIVGFDADTPDIFDRQIEFIERAGIPWAMVGTLTAIPKTQMWYRLEKEGRILGYADGDQFGRPNFRTKMDPKTLYEGYMKILRTIYDPDNYYERVLTVLGRHSRANFPKIRMTSYPIIKIVALLLKAIVVLGVLSSYRRSFWRFVGRVLRYHPRQITLAMTDSIMGHHFIRYTREVLARERTLLPREIPSSAVTQAESAPVAEGIAPK